MLLLKWMVQDKSCVQTSKAAVLMYLITGNTNRNLDELTTLQQFVIVHVFTSLTEAEHEDISSNYNTLC